MRRIRPAGRFAALLSTTVGCMLAASIVTAQPNGRVLLPGHVAPVTSDRTIALPVAKSAAADAEVVPLTVVMRRSDEAGLERLLASLYDPASPQFRKWLTPEEVTERFGPSTDDYARVERWFRSQGFTIAERTANRMTLGVTAPRAVVERTLEVRLADYKVYEPEGARAFFANLNDPSLPADIAARVHSIGGLSSAARPRPAIEAINRFFCAGEADAAGYNAENIGQSGRVCCEKMADDCLAKGRLKKAESVAKIKTDVCAKFKEGPNKECRRPDGTALDGRLAAKDGPVAWKDVDGSGQKVGITAFDRYSPEDVKDFHDLFGVDDAVFARLSRVAVNGGAAPGPDESEVLLDINTVQIGAPGAQVVVYDSPFGGGAFQSLFNRMISDNVSIISNSWAYCENQTSAADVQGIDTILAGAAAAGISVFTAVGDTGGTCLNGSPDTITVPSGSPRLTAVGGTTAIAGPEATWKSESWWTGSGGFGVSRFFVRPSYQNGYTASPTRSVPDVSFSSDPNQGVLICQASAGGCPAPLLFGGTSFAAPAWAAATALMNQAAGVRLGHLNPQMYALGATAAFHSPAELGSDFAHVGLGSPIFNALYRGLTGKGLGPVSATQSLVEQRDLRVAADGTSKTTIVVRLRDAEGNMVSGKTVALTQSAGGTAVIMPPTMITTAANGAAIFEVRNTTVQDVTFTVTDVTDGIVLAATPKVKFDVPPPAAGGIQAFPTTVQNNGTATTTITVTLVDANGQPTPNKVAMLTQGAGRSIITAPSPAMTDANGQIQFTATNRIAESVTYHAVVLTDGPVPVPGSANVTFSGQASASCVGAITPAAGFTATPIANGFLAEAFSFSNVNFACAGGTDPTFTSGGRFYVTNYRTGDLYLFAPQGGAASNANRLSTPGPTMQRPVLGKDGRLYAVRTATGSGFFSGQVVELDPDTGATLRVLASNLPCLGPPAVDPLSGDLFMAGQCFGAGSEDARLLRIVNPGSATPTVMTYAMLPGTPNGAVAFAPDGTLYVAVSYLAGNPPVVRISGTNQPQPPTITPVPGLHAVYWVNVGETLPNGAAKSLIVNTNDPKLRLVDITTDPPTFTDILVTGASSGTIGPDGCLYVNNGETLYRIAPQSGGCGFARPTASPSIALTPTAIAPDPAQGTVATFTARLVGVPNPVGKPVHFRVRGANSQVAMARADANGDAVFFYRGIFAGGDTIHADMDLDDRTLVSNPATVDWTAGTHATFLTLNASPTAATVGHPVTLTATLLDRATVPAAPLPGVSLAFSVGGQTCNAVTNASGVASCAVTVPLVGDYTLTVTFAGNASLTAASDSVGFSVLPPGPPPCVAFNDVDADDPFCTNVEWMRNRAVTLGCTTTLYCPVDAVSRLQMAAFMNRLGTTLAGVVRYAEAQPGAIDPDAQPVVCQTQDFATGAYARQAIVDAAFSARADADAAFAADAVASFDGGSTWLPIAAAANRGFATGGHWGHLRAGGAADLAPGDTVRFGLSIGRGGLPAGADLADSRCKLRVRIASR